MSISCDTKVNCLYESDCVQVLETQVLSSSIDLVYADPPYNLSGRPLTLVNNRTGGPFYKMNEKWDVWDYQEYVDFTNAWVTRCFRVLKPTGSLYVSCTFHNIAEVIVAAKKVGFKLNNILTWHKPNAMPNVTKRTFTHSTEYVCWFAKSHNWKFNYNALKHLNPSRTKNGNPKQMRDYMDFIELPIVQGRERLKGENGRALHPTQKPEKLIEIILTASSEERDIVLDPFFGTGTTGVVASRMNRYWIGIEAKPNYCEIALKRLKDAGVAINGFYRIV